MMAVEEISQARIDELIRMPKQVTNPNARRIDDGRFSRCDYQVKAKDSELQFRIYLRQNLLDARDFSCGIRWEMPSGETLTLKRYNGSSHIHGAIHYKCHIHTATEQAITERRKPERHADESTAYHTLDGALHCLVQDCNVNGINTQPDQPDLFNEL